MSQNIPRVAGLVVAGGSALARTVSRMVDYSKWDHFDAGDDDEDDEARPPVRCPYEGVDDEDDEDDEDEAEEEGEEEDEDEDEDECDELPVDIYEAAMERNWAVVKAWLECGGSPDAVPPGGTYLPAAASTPQRMEDLLLNTCCSDIDCPGCIGIPFHGLSLLHLASLAADFCKAMIHGRRARVDVSKPVPALLKPHVEKLAHDDAEMVHFLLDRGASIDLRNVAGQTPLMLACTRHDPRVVEILLARGADAEVQASDGRAALDFADPQLHEDVPYGANLQQGNVDRLQAHLRQQSRARAARAKPRSVTERAEAAALERAFVATAKAERAADAKKAEAAQAAAQAAADERLRKKEEERGHKHAKAEAKRQAEARREAEAAEGASELAQAREARRAEERARTVAAEKEEREERRRHAEAKAEAKASKQQQQQQAKRDAEAAGRRAVEERRAREAAEKEADKERKRAGWAEQRREAEERRRQIEQETVEKLRLEDEREAEAAEARRRKAKQLETAKAEADAINEAEAKLKAAMIPVSFKYAEPAKLGPAIEAAKKVAGVSQVAIEAAEAKLNEALAAAATADKQRRASELTMTAAGLLDNDKGRDKLVQDRFEQADDDNSGTLDTDEVISLIGTL